MNRTAPASESSWLVRHEFLLRRLHSLSGLVPVGAYMVVHLLTNASVMDSAGKFQENVYRIHSLGKALVLVEWGFIFLPLIFHAVFGVMIIRGGLPNNSNYPYANNLRYTLQRVSGVIAFLFIFWHVFHLHGWFHFDNWLANVAEPLGGAKFRPYNATSSLVLALQGFVIPTLYAIGMLACVFHLANGIWTMGITWGVWISPASQRRASWVCLIFGLGLAGVGLSALVGVKRIPVNETLLEREDLMYETRIGMYEAQSAGEEEETQEHKRWSAKERQEIEDQIGKTTDAEATSTETTSARVPSASLE